VKWFNVERGKQKTARFPDSDVIASVGYSESGGGVLLGIHEGFSGWARNRNREANIRQDLFPVKHPFIENPR